MLAAEFIGHANQAAMSCADGYLTVWDLDTCKMLRFVRMRDIQVGLRFCPAMNVLASWGVDDFDHDIVIWNVEDLAVVHVLNDGHSDPVKDVCEVALPQQGKGEDRVQRPWSPILGTLGHTNSGKRKVRGEVFISTMLEYAVALTARQGWVACSTVGSIIYFAQHAIFAVSRIVIHTEIPVLMAQTALVSSS